MFRFKKKEKIEIPLEVPKHIGIIMDGNGRWAKKRMQPRVFGHKAGMEALQEVTIAAKNMGVQVLTVYPFLRKTGHALKMKSSSSCTCRSSFMIVSSPNCIATMSRFK